MSWDSQQQARLALEKRILAEWFPQFEWHDPTEDTYLKGYLRTNSGRGYGVKVKLTDDYPESPPKALIFDPRPLLDRDGSPLEEYSYEMHTQKTTKKGNVQVCHYNDANWTESVTLCKVILKVRLWLEAYEGHLTTGNSIDHYLPHMEDDN
jgi:hypothetical protein